MKRGFWEAKTGGSRERLEVRGGATKNLMHVAAELIVNFSLPTYFKQQH